MTRERMLRIIVGFVCAPLVVGLATFWLFLLPYEAGYPLIGLPGAPYPARLALVVAIAAAAIGVLLTAIVAVPTFLWMKRRGHLSLARVVLAGVAIGDGTYVAVLVAALLFDRRSRSFMIATRDLFDRAPRVLAFGLFLAIIATTTAASFWLIAIRGSELD